MRFFVFLVLFASVFSFGFAGGTGTSEDPFQVSSAEELSSMRNDLDAHYVLNSDIDLSGFDTDSDSSNGNWAPIGSSSSSFTGSFDGNGFSITGLNVSVSLNYAGLFGMVDGASISNVNVAGSVVSTVHRVGGLIGTADDSNISYVSFSGNVSGDWHVGGLIGRSGDDLNVSFSNSSGMVNGIHGNIGGLIGLAGAGSTVSFSSSSSNVHSSSGDRIGGLIGFIYKDSDVFDSSAYGSVEGRNEVGGLVGLVGGGISISDSFSSGVVTSSGNLVGGLVGAIWSNSACPGSYWDIGASGKSSSACGFGYAGSNSSPFGGGSGTDNAPFIIGTYEHLNNVKNNLGAHYILIKDIDLFDVVWTPLGNREEPFTGSFNGKGNSITNLDVNSEFSFSGLFGFVRTGSISNLNLENVKAVGLSSVGSLSGAAVFSNISNVFVYSGNVEAFTNVGGLVGTVYGSNITSSSFEGIIYAFNSVGGIGGVVTSSSLDSVFSNVIVFGVGSSDFSGSDVLGGLVGSLQTSNISDSLSLFGFDVDFSLEGFNEVGGLVGSSSISSLCFDSYWDFESSNSKVSSCGVGKTTSDLKETNIGEGIFKNWNVSIWSSNSVSEYPSLLKK